jgi:hypothetical protein
MNNRNPDSTEPQGDPAYWRGNMVTFWVWVVIEIGITVVYGIVLTFGYNVGSWLLMALALIVAWVIPVLFIIPRTAPEGHVRYPEPPNAQPGD